MFRINQSAFNGGLSLKKLLILTCLTSVSLLSMSICHAQGQVGPKGTPIVPGGTPTSQEQVAPKGTPTGPVGTPIVPLGQDPAGRKEVRRLKENPTVSDCNEWLRNYGDGIYLSPICKNKGIRDSINACINIKWDPETQSSIDYACESKDENGNQGAQVYFTIERERLRTELRKLSDEMDKETNTIELAKMAIRRCSLTSQIDENARVIDTMIATCRQLKKDLTNARGFSSAIEAACVELDQKKIKG